MLSKYNMMMRQRATAALLFSCNSIIFNQSHLARRTFATNAAVTVLEKDYYSILDVPVTATPEQIKE